MFYTSTVAPGVRQVNQRKFATDWIFFSPSFILLGTLFSIFEVLSFVSFCIALTFSFDYFSLVYLGNISPYHRSRCVYFYCVCSFIIKAQKEKVSKLHTQFLINSTLLFPQFSDPSLPANYFWIFSLHNAFSLLSLIMLIPQLLSHMYSPCPLPSNLNPSCCIWLPNNSQKKEKTVPDTITHLGTGTGWSWVGQILQLMINLLIAWTGF